MIHASGDALAMSCGAILNMLQVGVPVNTVTITMQNSHATFTDEDINCLTQGGAPPQVITTAQGMRAAAPAPVPVRQPNVWAVVSARVESA